MLNECIPYDCEIVKKPENLAAKTVLSMVEDICWRIKDKVPADKQEEVILKFFKTLGSAKSLEDLAQKAVKIVSPKNMEKEVESDTETESDTEADKTDESDKNVSEEDFVLDLYIA